MVIGATLLIAAPFRAYSAAGDGDSDGIPDTVECSPPGPTALGNGGFESPDINDGSTDFLAEASVPNWDTTAADGAIELWDTDFNDFGQTQLPAHSGRQFAEINANEAAALFQDLPTPPGTLFLYSVFHRGRRSASMPDVMELRIGPQATSTTDARTADVAALPLVVTASDTNQAWGEYSGLYRVPAGQSTTRFGFLAVSSAGGPTFGNFLDSVAFNPCPDTDSDGTADALDSDSDGDGLPDRVEGTEDDDLDGVPDFRDALVPIPNTTTTVLPTTTTVLPTTTTVPTGTTTTTSTPATTTTTQPDRLSDSGSESVVLTAVASLLLNIGALTILASRHWPAAGPR